MIKLINILFFSLFSYAAQSEVIELVLPVHQRHSIRIPSTGNISATDKQYVSLSLQGANLQIYTKKIGESKFFVDNQEYLVQVVSSETATHFKALEKITHSTLSAKARLQNGQVHITGKLYSLQDLQKILRFRKNHNLDLAFKVHLPAYLKEELQRMLTFTLEKHQLSPQKILFDPFPQVYLSPKISALEKVREIIKNLGIEVVITNESLELQPTIKVQVYIAEIKKNKASQFGIQWPRSLNASVLPGSGPQYDEAFFSASAFEGQGLGKIIAQPTLLTRSGEEAKFHAGGEFPIKILKFRTQEVFWKTYGLTLSIKPEVDRSGRLKIKLDTEITSIDKGTSTDDIPGVKTNKVSSQFDLAKSQTIAISGLVSAEEFSSNSGLPALKNLPILGQIFSSEDFLSQKTELVIFVKPEVLKETL